MSHIVKRGGEDLKEIPYFLIFFIYTFQCISSRNKVLSLENLSQSKASQEKFNRLNVIYQFFSPTKRSFNIQTVDNSCGSMFCCPGNWQQKYFYKLTETLLSMSNAQQSQVLCPSILSKLFIYLLLSNIFNHIKEINI